MLAFSGPSWVGLPGSWVLPAQLGSLCWGQGGAQASSWLGLTPPPLLAAIRVSCTGSCRVSSKANDASWVVEEGYFNSALSLADKGESVWEPVCPPHLSIRLWEHRTGPPSPKAVHSGGFPFLAGFGHRLIGAGWLKGASFFSGTVLSPCCSSQTLAPHPLPRPWP